MEARYPSIGEASPAEIFAAYKDLPQAPGGLDILKRIVQQNQNTGNMRGSIATSILNDAIAAKPTPPMPQGTVADQVVAQATPPAPAPMPMDPNMAGLAAPGLEQMAQQHAATGGLIALSHGGPVQGYSGLDGSGVRFSEGPLRPYGETADPIIEDEYGDLPTDVPAVTYADVPVPGHMGGPNFGHVARGEPRSDVMRSDVNEILHRMGRSGPGQRLQSIVDRMTDAPHRWSERWDAAGKKLAAREHPAGDGSPSYAPEFVEAMSASPELPSMPTVTGKGMPISFGSSSASPGIPSAKTVSTGGAGGTSGGASPTVVVDTGDEGIPAAKPPEERTMGGTSGRVPELSTEAQIASLAKFFGGDHSMAAELKGQMEKRLASKENKDLISDIATGLGAMFSGQGTKTQAAGAGLMAFAAQRAHSGADQDRLQSTIDAMTLQDEAQRNAATQAAAQTVFGAQTKKALQEQGFLYDTYLHRLDNEAKIKAAIARASGGYDHFSRKQADIDQALSSAQQRAQNDKDWPTLSRAQQQARIETYLPPDLQGMFGGMTAGATPQSSYNLPPGYGYTPG